MYKDKPEQSVGELKDELEEQDLNVDENAGSGSEDGSEDSYYSTSDEDQVMEGDSEDQDEEGDSEYQDEEGDSEDKVPVDVVLPKVASNTEEDKEKRIEEFRQAKEFILSRMEVMKTELKNYNGPERTLDDMVKPFLDLMKLAEEHGHGKFVEMFHRQMDDDMLFGSFDMSL